MKSIGSPSPVGVRCYQKRGGNTWLSAFAVLAWGGSAGCCNARRHPGCRSKGIEKSVSCCRLNSWLRSFYLGQRVISSFKSARRAARGPGYQSNSDCQHFSTRLDTQLSAMKNVATCAGNTWMAGLFTHKLATWETQETYCMRVSRAFLSPKFLIYE